MNCPKVPPFWSARKSRHFGPPKRVATLVRPIESPFMPAKETHQCNPPAQNSQAGHGPLASPPPPPRPVSVQRRREGEGVGASQARQSTPNRYFYFTAPYMAYIGMCFTYTQHFYLQYRADYSLRKYNQYIAFRRRKLLARKE